MALLWLVQGTGAVAEPLNLSPIQSAQWDVDKARHLASRAGFGASAEELAKVPGISGTIAHQIYNALHE